MRVGLEPLQLTRSLFHKIALFSSFKTLTKQRTVAPTPRTRLSYVHETRPRSRPRAARRHLPSLPRRPIRRPPPPRQKPKPPRASILSKNHNRMVSESQIRTRTEAALALKNASSVPSSQPTMAELACPSGKQPRNGGMSTRQIIEERNRVRKARSRPTSATTTDDILGISNPNAGNDNASKDPSPEKTVSDTLAWVRAKSAERRSKRLIQT